MVLIADLSLDGSPLDGVTVNATLSETAPSGTLIGQLAGGTRWQLVNSAGGQVFLDGNQLRLSEGAMLDDSAGPLTITLQARDALGEIVTRQAVIAIGPGGQEVIRGGAGRNAIDTDDFQAQIVVGGRGDDTLTVGRNDILGFSGDRSDYQITVVLPEPPDSYGGETDPIRITLRDLRPGGQDGTDLVLTDFDPRFRFADGDFSLEELTQTGNTGLTLDGRDLQIDGYILENEAPGALGQLGLRGLPGEAPVITRITVNTVDSRGLYSDPLVGADNPFFIDAAGVLRTSRPLDFESADNYTVTLEYQDSTGRVSVDSLVFKTLDADDAPILDRAPGLGFKMGVPLGTDMTGDLFLGVLETRDVDGTTGIVSLALTGADADKFLIRDGMLFLKAGTNLITGAAFDFDVQVVVSDTSQPAGVTFDLDIGVILPDPLDAISTTYEAPSQIRVFIAPGGQALVELYSLFQDPPPSISVGFSIDQVAAIQTAFGRFAAVANLEISFVTSLSEANFALIGAASLGSSVAADWGIEGGTLTVGSQTANLEGWGHVDMGDFAAGSFAEGTAAFNILLSLVGLSLGLANPHAESFGSEIMEGVTSPTLDYGVFDLNQGVHTVMSFNRGWHTGPMGAPVSGGTGFVAGPSALDIAALQQKYGAKVSHAGDDSYVLGAETHFLTLWDTGGLDRITYAGVSDVVISLQAATLDYTSTGGGVVSHVAGQTGGFTLAAGTVIENAFSGSGDDLLTGNGLGNRLVSGSGNDTLLGGAGDDTLLGGYGADRIEGGEGRDRVSYHVSTAVTVNLANGTGARGQARGDVLVGIEDVQGSDFDDIIRGNGEDNRLMGGAGDDRLIAGGGDDSLVGGTGADVFVFWTGSGRDWIVDFDLDDRIEITQSLWDALGAASIGDFLASRATQVDAHVALDFGDGNLLRLAQTDLADILAAEARFLVV